MRTFNVVVERDPDTGLLVGHVPGWPGAHSQGESMDELQANVREVIAMLCSTDLALIGHTIGRGQHDE